MDSALASLAMYRIAGVPAVSGSSRCAERNAGTPGPRIGPGEVFHLVRADEIMRGCENEMEVSLF